MLTPIVDNPDDPNIRATGHFALGTEAVFFFDFVDTDGKLYDPSDIDLDITDPLGASEVDADSVQKIRLGQYAYSWKIPTGSESGKYTIVLTYVVEKTTGPVTRTLTEEFVVSEWPQRAQNSDFAALIAYLTNQLQEFQRIPVYDEIVRLNVAKTEGFVTFGKWNRTANPRLYLNGDLRESGYSFDYNGKVFFNFALSEIDEVRIDYNFKWFSDDELMDFLNMGLRKVNLYPTQSTWLWWQVPDRFALTVERAALIEALRAILMSLMLQEPAKVFGGLDRAKDIFGQMETLKQNQEKTLSEELEQKKLQSYAGLTKTITVPEFTLPGGRCFADDVEIICSINNSYPQSVVITDIFRAYENGENIKVLSHNTIYETINSIYEDVHHMHADVSNSMYEELDQQNISKIWKSGIKTVFELTTESGKKIKTSEEHLFFIKNKGYIPLKDISIGDYVLSTEDDKNLLSDSVISIKNAGKVETYDIEVPETENLIANGIKCHNSRWFRMLFSGS